MKRLASVAALMALLTGAASAQGATTTLTITINSPPSTSITCGSGSFVFTAPVAAGTVVCPLAVQPANWAGGFTLTQQSGPQANAFAISGSNLVVGAASLTAPGAYSLSVSAVP